MSVYISKCREKGLHYLVLYTYNVHTHTHLDMMIRIWLLDTTLVNKSWLQKGSQRDSILKAISNTLTFIKDEKEWKQTKTFKKIITFRYKFYFNFLKRFDYRKDLKATLFLKLYQHMSIFQRQKEMKTHENIKK